MPADDLLLNVRQIGNYPATGDALPGDLVLLQRGGLGGPYLSILTDQLVATALAGGGPLSVGAGYPPADAVIPQIFTDNIVVALGATHNWNCYFSTNNSFVARSTGPAAVFGFMAPAGFVWGAAPSVAAGASVSLADLMTLSPAGQLNLFENSITLPRDPIGPMEATTAQWVEAVVADLQATTVWTFNDRRGDVRLWLDDILCAGGAPIFSPRFQGSPRADTPPPWSNSSRLATTGFVHRNSVEYITCLLKDHPFVFSFNGRSGAVVLTADDLSAAMLAGEPQSSTPPPGDSSARVATTAFVAAAITSATDDLADTYAPIDSPTLTGYATAPTAAAGSVTGQIATTAFVMNAIAAATAGVASFNGRTGIVTLESTDIIAAGGAPIASPVFTGTPQAPTANPGTATNQIATCAWVMDEIGGVTSGVISFNGRAGPVILTSGDLAGAGGALIDSPAFGGTPTAPTATTGTSTDQLATTAFVQGAIAAISTGVISFNGREGAITLTSNDISAAGGAPSASPILTGTPQGPTAAPGTSSAQLATTAFVAAAIATVAGVTTFNGRSGAITLSTADITGAGGAAAADYLPLTGGTLSAGLTVLGGIQAQTLLVRPLVGVATAGMGLVNSAGTVLSQWVASTTSGSVSLTAPIVGGSLTLTGDVQMQPGTGHNFLLNVGVGFQSGGGTWASLSDARIKTVQAEYEEGLAELTQLRPVVYTYRGNDSVDAGGESFNKGAADARTRFVGLIAQEVEPVMPDLVTKRSGYIGGEAVNDLRVLNTTPLVFALINAVKELASRVAALEGGTS